MKRRHFLVSVLAAAALVCAVLFAAFGPVALAAALLCPVVVWTFDHALKGGLARLTPPRLSNGGHSFARPQTGAPERTAFA